MHFHGRPKHTFSDQGSHFTSFEFAHWRFRHGIRRIIAAPNMHKSFGFVERMNQTLVGRLRRMLYKGEHSDWSRMLPIAMQIINETPNEITGYSPESLTHAGPNEWKKAMQRTTEHRQKINKRFQSKRIKRHYAVGQRYGYETTLVRNN